jgi:prepilin-type processing-associated H-X9-DG protein
MVDDQELGMEGNTTTRKGISPAIIFGCLLLVMAGFFIYQFPYAHHGHQYTRELYVYGNGAACVLFLVSLVIGLAKKYRRVNLIALLFLILGLFLLWMHLLLDRYRLESRFGETILFSSMIMSGGLAALSAFVAFYSRRTAHDTWLSAGVLFLLCVNFVLPEFTRPHVSKGQLCRVRLRGLCVAIESYTGTNDQWPNPSIWCETLVRECDTNKKDMCCPYIKDGLCSYAMNENIPKDTKDLPRDLVLLFESLPGWNRTGGPDDVITDRHDKNNPGAMIAFADGHVEYVKTDKISSLCWTIKTQPLTETEK